MLSRAAGSYRHSRRPCALLTHPATLTWLLQERTQQKQFKGGRGGWLQLTVPGTVHPGSRRVEQLVTLPADTERPEISVSFSFVLSLRL